MRSTELLYNAGTLTNYAAFFTSLIASIQNAYNADPKIEQTLFICMAGLGTYMTLPEVLSGHGTTRERLKYMGYTIIEGIAITCNALAFRKKNPGAYAAAIVAASVACAMLAIQLKKFNTATAA